MLLTGLCSKGAHRYEFMVAYPGYFIARFPRPCLSLVNTQHTTTTHDSTAVLQYCSVLDQQRRKADCNSYTILEFPNNIASVVSMTDQHVGDTVKLVGAMMRLRHNTKFKVGE